MLAGIAFALKVPFIPYLIEQFGFMPYLFNAVILQVSNKWRRVKELQKHSQSFMNNLKDWSNAILS